MSYLLLSMERMTYVPSPPPPPWLFRKQSELSLSWGEGRWQSLSGKRSS